MGDFVRRPPETGEKVFFPAQPVSFNAEPGVAEDVELPSEIWRRPEPAPKLEILPDPDEGESPIAPPWRLLAPARELAKHLGRGVTIKFHRFNRPWKKRFPGQALRRAASQVAATVASRVPGPAASHLWKRAAGQVLKRAAGKGRAGIQSCRNGCRHIADFSRGSLQWTLDLFSARPAKLWWSRIPSSARWLGRPAVARPAVAFATVLVVAIVVGWGISRDRAPSTLDRAPSTKDSQTSPGKIAAAPNVNSPTNPEPERAVAASAVPTAASKSEAKPTPITKTPTVHTKSRKSRPPRSPGTAEDEVVAHDTVTYFNKSAPVAPSRDSSSSRARSRKQGGDAAPAGASPI